jgi:drug/metabolite transporter (DMT)-like permease
LKGHPYLYGLIFLMIFFWSANYIVGKVALREFPPLELSGVRIGMAGLLMLPVYWWRGQPPPGRRDSLDTASILRLTVLGFFGVAMNQLFFVVGLGRTTVAHASIIVSLGPVLVLVIAAGRKLERLTSRKLAGMLIAIAGVAMLRLLQTHASVRHATWFGDTFVFLSTLFFALFTVFGKPVTREYSSITVNTVAYVSGGLLLAPITIWQARLYPFSHISLTAWACAFYMALCPSVLAYLIYYYALTHIDASRVASFSYLQPVFATSMAVFLLDEHLTTPVVTSGLAILAGVYITERC